MYLQVMLGFVALVMGAIAAAYCLEAASECVRSSVASINSTDINILLEHRSLAYRVVASAIVGLVLWGGLRLFSVAFHKLKLSLLEPVASGRSLYGRIYSTALLKRVLSLIRRCEERTWSFLTHNAGVTPIASPKLAATMRWLEVTLSPSCLSTA
jgi:hypothetical protein